MANATAFVLKRRSVGPAESCLDLTMLALCLGCSKVLYMRPLASKKVQLMPPSLLIVALVATFALQAQAADWDEYPVPAAPPMGYEWQLDPVSDDFNYNSPALPKTSEFTDKWVDHFINNWQGPGFTDWEANHSLVQNGHLELLASRKGTSEVYAGAVSSHATFTYPLYVEVRVKINRLVTATGVWMLSADSEEEIDIAEAYGSDRVGQEWYAQRMHLSHHVFVRNPFQDYQPTDSGTWYHDGTLWADDFRRIGVYWRDPYHLEYYVDGVLVRTTSGEGIIDPQGYTDGTGLSEPMHLLFTVEDQTWRSAAPPNGQGLTPTDEELADPNKNTARVDWLRVYKAVPQAVQAEIATTDTEIALNFSKARPYLFYQVLQAEGLDAPNWTPALTDLQFNSQGLASLSRTIESTQHFFDFRPTPMRPYSPPLTGRSTRANGMRATTKRKHTMGSHYWPVVAPQCMTVATAGAEVMDKPSRQTMHKMPFRVPTRCNSRERSRTSKCCRLM